MYTLVLTVLAIGTGCPKAPPPPQIYKIGERVQSGPLVYNVFEAQWKSQIGSGSSARIPARRFLAIHFNVTNSAPEPVAIPPLTLSDDSGRLFGEYLDGADIPNLLGLIRNVKPVETVDAVVLFDVEPRSYKLKLDDGSASGRIAMVEMPLQFEMGRPDVLGANPMTR